jgi:hypothetical protein
LGLISLRYSKTLNYERQNTNKKTKCIILR